MSDTIMSVLYFPMYPLAEEHGDDEELCDKGQGQKFNK